MALVEIPPGFARSFLGDLLQSGDDGYDAARQVHNGLIDKRPGLIARCREPSDVAAAVELARDGQLEVSVRGGGHSVAGRAVTDGGLMIDLALMKEITVVPPARTVEAAGGVTWGELDAATHEHGLVTPGGIVSSTGIAGLTLGGGLGWTQGRFGLTVDNLVAAELVTADGTIVTASEHDHPDLFWALRGGGGNFGVVTRFAYRTHPLTSVLGGTVAYPAAHARPVLETSREVTATAPDELSVQVGLLHLPGRTRTAAAGLSFCHCGDDGADAARAVEPLRGAGQPIIDAVNPMPYPAINRQTDPLFPRGARNYWKQAFVDEIGDALIDGLVEAFAACPSDMSVLVIEQLHGAAARVAPHATAFPYRTTGYAVLLCGQWRDPGADEVNITWGRQTFAALRPHLGARRYVNYMSVDDTADAAAYGPNHERLVAVKRRYDPTNLFRLNQNIDPGENR